MISVNVFAISAKQNNPNDFVYEIGPLPKGYADTFGVVLRRILLSSIPGAAITSIKIEGLQHEFSTLEGLSDDVLMIVLSLKNIVVNLKTLEPQVLRLEVRGEDGISKEIKAGDFESNSMVDIINKDYVITHITGSKSVFKAEVTVERGVGFKVSNSSDRTEIGRIPVDAKFSPVTFVHYYVSQTRVGQETELDQLNLNIKTNGSISPNEALSLAIDVLNDGVAHFKQETVKLLSGEEISIKLNDESKKLSLNTSLTSNSQTNNIKNLSKKSLKDDVSIVDLNLSTRLTNALLKSNITTLSQFEGMTEEEVANIRGLGSKTLEELMELLKKYSIKLV